MKIPESARIALQELLGNRFSTAPGVLAEHDHDAAWHPPRLPDAVVFPESTREVAKIAEICSAHGVPMIPWGAGTSLEGQVLATRGGVTIDLRYMDQILAVRPEDLDATVQPAVTRQKLNRLAGQHGLFFPVDPGAEASLGGMTATRASGTNAVRYGTMRDNVLSLEIVMADGKTIRTSKRARKTSAGYDLTGLFVGSEGTLGIITEITLKLYGRPEAISAAVVSFPDLKSATQTAIQTIQSGISVARIELLDALLMGAVNQYAQLDYTPAPTLMLEFHGSPSGVEEQADEVAAIAHEHGGSDFRWSSEAAERAKLWEARHHAYYAALSLRSGCQGWTTDVCVPISRLAECILETQEDLVDSPLQAPLVGHVGDGNFHLLMLIDRDQPTEVDEAERIHHRLIERALRMDGTATGEHGVGIGKASFMPAEHGEALDAMRLIKLALDPAGLMNPGKIWP